LRLLSPGRSFLAPRFDYKQHTVLFVTRRAHLGGLDKGCSAKSVQPSEPLYGKANAAQGLPEHFCFAVFSLFSSKLHSCS
jgi:hypothetical protein